jgi:hypothetical protein
VLEHELLGVRQGDLRRQIREAEQRGDLQTALQLAEELDRARDKRQW